MNYILNHFSNPIQFLSFERPNFEYNIGVTGNSLSIIINELISREYHEVRIVSERECLILNQNLEPDAYKFGLDDDESLFIYCQDEEWIFFCIIDFEMGVLFSKNDPDKTLNGVNIIDVKSAFSEEVDRRLGSARRFYNSQLTQKFRYLAQSPSEVP